jgi:hypothetical protein
MRAKRKSIWHYAAAEMPVNGTKIVCVTRKKEWFQGEYFDDGTGFTNTFETSKLFGLLKKKVNIVYDVEKWAYLDDINNV